MGLCRYKGCMLYNNMRSIALAMTYSFTNAKCDRLKTTVINPDATGNDACKKRAEGAAVDANLILIPAPEDLLLFWPSLLPE